MLLHLLSCVARCAAVLSFVAVVVPAQWSGNPAQNLAVADGTGEQVLPKLARTRDGGTWVGWFDSRNGAYEVRLQRLARDGVEAWPHNGLVVSNNPQSTSLVDWDLIADRDGGCVLTFTDTRAGGDLDVYAYRFDAAGAPLWGANGIALSNNPDYEPNPRVVQASDGAFVFTWVNSVTRTLRLQRVDAQGVPQFAQDGIAFAADVGATPGFVQLVAADAGSVILSWMRAIAFNGQRHLHAMKFDALGNPVWNGGVRLPVFDQASVPIAHQHKMLPDGQGGAWIAWHFAPTQQFQVRVQHLSANGVELCPHNGANVSATANSQFDPAVAVDAAAGAVTVFWNERNLAQSQWGIGAQRLDALGTSQWGSTGITLAAVGGTTWFAPVAAPFAGGAYGAVLEQSLGGQASAVRVFAVDANGAQLWAGSTAVSTAVSDKLRLQLASMPSGAAVLAWTDLRNGAGDLYAQAVASDASLTPTLATVTPYGCGANPPASLTVDVPPAFAATVRIAVDNPLGTQPNGALPVVLFTTSPLPNYPCGANLPGFGLAGPATPGELLVDTTTLGLSLVLPPWSPGQPATTTFAVPYGPPLLGFALFVQGALLDLTPGATVPIGLTAAQRWVLGY